MRDETEDNKPKPQETTVGDAKMTADERVAAARIGRFHEHVAIDAVWCADAIAIAEAHAAAAVAEVAKERDSARSGATLAEGRLLELLDVLRERTDALDRVAKERDETLTKYAFMVERAADTKLDGYRELASKLEQAEARVKELEAEVERLRVLRPWAEPFVPTAFACIRRAFSLAELMCVRDAEIVLDVRMRAMVVSLRAALAPQAPPAQLHPATTDLVHRFAAALREKLAAAEQKYGYSDNWRADDWLDECRAQLAAHVAKGDPRDVAAYCAFLWHHGASTAPQAPKEVPRG